MVRAAKELGIVSGVSETEFGVGMRITREDMAVMIARTAEKKGIALSYGTPVEFADASDISSYAVDSVARLSAADVLSGDENGLFTPRGMATRAQAAKIISVLLFGE